MHSLAMPTLSDILDYSSKRPYASPDVPPLAYSPLRCIHRTATPGTFEVRKYRPGEKYYAISYTWPSPNWTRQPLSDAPTTIVYDAIEASIPAGKSPYQSHHFSAFAAAVVSSLANQYPVWVDAICINQEDFVEKTAQVNVMEHIYNQAEMTIVLLEDTHITQEELAVFRGKLPGLHDPRRQRHTEIIRRIVNARWFSRAWTTQELLLSRRVWVAFHSDDGVIEGMNVGMLAVWVDYAARADPAIKPLSPPRGFDTNHRKSIDAMGMHTMAWSFGVVYPMGCFNEYDKIQLALNICRVPVEQKLDVIPRGTEQEMASNGPMQRVCQVLNVYAVTNDDYSLLLAAHGKRLPFQQEDGFGWCGAPIKGDPASEAWIRKHYSFRRDATRNLDRDGLHISGYVKRITSVSRWAIKRLTPTDLQIDVDGARTVVRSDWFEKPLKTDPLLRPLVDLVYALAAHEAKDIYSYFSPPSCDFDWPEYEPILADDLKGEITANYSRFGPGHYGLELAIRHMHKGIGTTIGFNVLGLEGCDMRLPLVVNGDYGCGELLGKSLFQPHVTRPKYFASNLMTVNSMVLEGEGWRRRCVGGVRGFGLIPEYNEQRLCIF